MSNKPLPEWDRVLTAAANFGKLFPDSAVVGGTAASLYTGHRISSDADHILPDLKHRFDDVLAQLE